MVAPSPAPRDRVLAVAAESFYQRGIQATSVDEIIAAARVAKATFYHHFPSKEALVSTYLHQRHERWMQEFQAHLARQPAAGLGPVADALAAWFAEPSFSGCAFINLFAETTEPRLRALATAHKEALRELLAARLPTRWALPRRRKVSHQALLVVEGMIVRYQMTRERTVIALGRELLLSLTATRASGNGG